MDEFMETKLNSSVQGMEEGDSCEQALCICCLRVGKCNKMKVNVETLLVANITLYIYCYNFKCVFFKGSSNFLLNTPMGAVCLPYVSC